ncbi:protein fem-1-like protein [Elysia marginata]|uniref:Protein fem-1-like protein n=1 Tax=Elysia marginata TaxID=1093978 RepID=A0AAV4J1G5_9GAST|nr:protein fem-1-like protein [Elysia marginata]
MLQTRAASGIHNIERSNMYRPVHRKFNINRHHLRLDTSNSPYNSQRSSDRTTNLSVCLSVTQKDIVSTRPAKVKADDQFKAVKIPPETFKFSAALKPVSSTRQNVRRANGNSSTNLSLQTVDSTAQGRAGEEKAKSAPKCAIVRATSRGLLHVNVKDASITEKPSAGFTDRATKETKGIVSPSTACRPSSKMKSPFVRLLARNKLTNSYNKVGFDSFPASRNSRRNISNNELATSFGSTSSQVKAAGVFLGDNISTRSISGDPRIKPGISHIPSSLLSNKQRSVVPGGSRSKSSTGHHVTPTETSIGRKTKSARPHRCTSHTNNDLGCLLDQQTVARLAARMEGHVIENNGQNLQAGLTPLCLPARAQVVNFRADPSASSSPFFRACQLTRLPIVEWMLRESQPDLEQTGVFLQPGDATLYQVTPLWYASATGNLELVRLLASFGADVNASTETGSTAVRAACCTGQVGVVQFLVAHGADLHVKTQHGVTTLMSSVHSVPLTKFALHHGVTINASDEQGNTALHYAAEAGHPEVTRLLVETGADATVVNKAGCSPLQGAAENRHQEVTEYLIQCVSPRLEEIIDAYSILGAMIIMVNGNVPHGLACWHRALTLTCINSGTSSGSKPSPAPPPQSPSSSIVISSPRLNTPSLTHRISKSALSKSRKCPSFLERELGIDEITTTRELALVASDYDALCMQALLVYERIRGVSHENLVSLIMYRGAMSADCGDYKRAAHLWVVAYELQLQKCSSGLLDVYHPRMCRNVRFLCRVLYHMGTNNPNNSPQPILIEEERFSKLFGMICSHALKALHKPAVHFEPETSNLDFLLTALLTLLCAYLQMYTSQERTMQFWQHLREMVRVNPKDSKSKSLLGMCLERDRFLPYTEVPRFDLEAPVPGKVFSWPCRPMLEILLLLGADPLVRDNNGDTVLHTVVMTISHEPSGSDLDTDTVVMLLKHGAHADQVNREKATPLDLLSASEVGIRRVLQNKISLQCLAARVIVSKSIPYIGEIPKSLYAFVELHAS